jgi:hypothetical protein
VVPWLGCANNDIALRDRVILLDAWYDRRSAQPAARIAPHDVTRADLIIDGHAHFDNIADISTSRADRCLSHVCPDFERLSLRAQGLPDDQLLTTPAVCLAMRWPPLQRHGRRAATSRRGAGSRPLRFVDHHARHHRVPADLRQRTPCR